MAKKPPDEPRGDFPKMSNPAVRALHTAGYTRLEQLTNATEAEIAKLHGMGPKSIKELNAALSARELSFKKPAK